MRLDLYLVQNYPEASRATWQKLIKRGDVTINGSVVIEPKLSVNETDDVKVKEVGQTAAKIDLPVLYEDENVVVINKPAGILTHSKGALNDEFTVADFIKSRTPLQGRSLQRESNRFGIVHRLDRATSGVIIGAKNLETLNKLQRQFSDRKVKKTYLAIVERTPKELQARIDLPIARNPKYPSQFRVDPKGKSAVTDYKVKETFVDGSALIELKPLTGRTHQLRAHMAHIGAPIVGDAVYGLKNEIGRMFLYAAELEVTIPGKDNKAESQRKTFRADLPPDFTEWKEAHEL